MRVGSFVIGLLNSGRSGLCTVTIVNLEEVLNVKRDDIDINHRIKRKKTKPILARFISHKVRRALYKQRV